MYCITRLAKCNYYDKIQADTIGDARSKQGSKEKLFRLENMKEQDHLESKGVDQTFILMVSFEPELRTRAMSNDNCKKENHVTE